MVAVDDQGVEIAAVAGERLGFRHNDPVAAAATRDKVAMRGALAEAGVAQPRFAVVLDPDAVSQSIVERVGLPCVVKPIGLSASRGVIRADNLEAARAAATRVRAIADGPLLVEEYVPGDEVAVEGLLRGGSLDVLAVFDKPDPLVGPYFEETIYVTPSRLPPTTLDGVGALTAQAAARDRAHRGADPRRGAHRRRPDVAHRGRGALHRWAVRSHVAFRRGHRARGADPAARARHGDRRPRPRDASPPA